MARWTILPILTWTDLMTVLTEMLVMMVQLKTVRIHYFGLVQTQTEMEERILILIRILIVIQGPIHMTWIVIMMVSAIAAKLDLQMQTATASVMEQEAPMDGMILLMLW